MMPEYFAGKAVNLMHEKFPWPSPPPPENQLAADTSASVFGLTLMALDAGNVTKILGNT